MAAHSSTKRVVESTTIPDRLYFKIGDVARICKVETYVLRFWETQFPQLRPNKSGTGQRLYRRRDVEIALEIKRLVYGQGYTLSGARQALGQSRRAESAPRVEAPVEQPSAEAAPVRNRDAVAAAVGRARAELREIAALLSAPDPQAQPPSPLPRRRPRISQMTSTTGSLFPS